MVVATSALVVATSFTDAKALLRGSEVSSGIAKSAGLGTRVNYGGSLVRSDYPRWQDVEDWRRESSKEED
jgi:hypothetical protein